MRLFLSQAQRAILIVIPVAGAPNKNMEEFGRGLKPATTGMLIDIIRGQ